MGILICREFDTAETWSREVLETPHGDWTDNLILAPRAQALVNASLEEANKPVYLEVALRLWQFLWPEVAAKSPQIDELFQLMQERCQELSQNWKFRKEEVDKWVRGGSVDDSGDKADTNR